MGRTNSQCTKSALSLDKNIQLFIKLWNQSTTLKAWMIVGSFHNNEKHDLITIINLKRDLIFFILNYQRKYMYEQQVNNILQYKEL